MAKPTTSSSTTPDPQGHIAADSDAPLLCADQSDFAGLMSLKDFAGESRSALAGFKSRWNKSRWMQAQRGYLQKACLAAASLQRDVLDLCRCGLGYKDRFGRHRFQTCRKSLLCPSCNLHHRVEPCVWEFLPAFGKAPFWYALTFGWQSNPREAGLRLVIEQDELGRSLRTRDWLPWSRRQDAPLAFRYDLDFHSDLLDMAELAFEFAGNLCPRWLSGLYGAFEWSFSFYPRRDHLPGELSCFHTALPHLHGFGNCERELGFNDCREIFRLYYETCLELNNPGLVSYPDLQVSRLVEESNLRRWVGYNLKAIPFEQFYRDGIRHGCSLESLNLEFQQTVWNAINIVRTPRKFGNLNPLTSGYIAQQQFRKLSKVNLEQLLAKSEKDGLSPSEAQKLERHFFACEQQREHSREIRERRERRKREEALADQLQDETLKHET